MPILVVEQRRTSDYVYRERVRRIAVLLSQLIYWV
jgi:hypothetical protein